jgi:hypothetical protein
VSGDIIAGTLLRETVSALSFEAQKLKLKKARWAAMLAGNTALL